MGWNYWDGEIGVGGLKGFKGRWAMRKPSPVSIALQDVNSRFIMYVYFQGSVPATRPNHRLRLRTPQP